MSNAHSLFSLISFFDLIAFPFIIYFNVQLDIFSLYSQLKKTSQYF